MWAEREVASKAEFFGLFGFRSLQILLNEDVSAKMGFVFNTFKRRNYMLRVTNVEDKSTYVDWRGWN